MGRGPGKAKREELERQRESARKAAEEDARLALLAAGYMPGEANESELVARILAGGTTPPELCYSRKEFCARVDISLSTYYRLRRAGRGPQEFHILPDVPRISLAAAEAWMRDNAELLPPAPPRAPEPAPGIVIPREPRRRRRAVVPEARGLNTSAKPVNGPSIYDPPLPAATVNKLRRKRDNTEE